MNGWVLPFIGALTGLHAATWGGYKDSPFEGFRVTSFARSVVLGTSCALLLWVSGAADSMPLLLAVGLCYSAERLVTEWWKTILREDPQAGYAIPMRLAVGGRPIDARGPRYAVGVLVLGGFVGACLFASYLQGRLPERWPWWGTALFVGLGGWLTALGGAWKDAPIEGFQTAKFFRSPVVATAWGCLLMSFTSSLPLLTIAAGGWSVVTIETFKTFLVDGSPGKFAGQQVRFLPGRAQALCGLAHAAWYGLLGCTVAVNVLLEGPVRAAPGPISREAALLVVLVWATGFGTQVLGNVPSANVRSDQGSRHPAEPAGRQSDADIRRASS